ncbi:MAG: right-handed parallel beta-helix repeat-containing protein [Candidatus Eremiobacteraeota bacterium]|nr:right-handed parallel beta-helix repeat-containing protein [Candidatus Eremiobacteraeota bacterium]
MKNNIILGTVVLLVLMTFAGSAQAATTYTVDDDGPADFATVLAALNAASDGDTIEVAAGTYTNDIWDSSLGIPAGYRITKSITLLGAQAGVDPAGSTDRGGETILVRTNGLPYSLYASGITIDGFMFGSSDPNTGERLIISDVADNAIIRNCIIQNTPTTSSGHGVYIYPGAKNALVEYNTFYNTAWEAIASWHVSNVVITHNYITSSGQHAIQMMGHAGTNNEISYNHISGIAGKNAIHYWGGPGAIISHNVIDGGNTMYDGIWLDNAADGSTVSDNQIFDAIYAGINIRETCTGASIIHNDISGCGYGIEKHLGNVSGTTINCNCISGNDYGVVNWDSITINAENNWWGDVSGPYHASNLNEMGDMVYGNVDYDPWLTELAYSGVTTFANTEDVILQATLHNSDNGAECGAVSFYIDGIYTNSNTIYSSGVATLDVGTMPVGVYEIRAVSGCMETSALIAVYDPSAGFVTGGGWIDSPPGAFIADDTLSGKANFGFVSKYKKGADTPTGTTQFKFKVADFDFRSESYDWLVIAGARAQYRGTGTINGVGNYGIMLTAIDEVLTPSTDVDLFRIKIWDKDSGNIVYDNQLGASDTGVDATALGGGSIVIHKPKPKK